MSFIYDLIFGSSSKPVLDKSEFRSFKLIEKKQLSHNTAKYRFQLPNPSDELNLPIGQHISVRTVLPDGKEVLRSYTPTSLPTEKGYFDLVIKTYPEGVMSGMFAKLQIGNVIEVRGPKGNFNYSKNMCKAIGMIAGGTGITPMYQIIKFILENSDSDSTKINLIFANVNEDDILLREELKELEASHKSQLKVYYVLNNPPSVWDGGVGFVTKEMIKENCPAPGSDMKLLICGPPPMVKAMCQHAEDLGYDKPNVISKLEDMVFKF